MGIFPARRRRPPGLIRDGEFAAVEPRPSQGERERAPATAASSSPARVRARWRGPTASRAWWRNRREAAGRGMKWCSARSSEPRSSGRTTPVSCGQRRSTRRAGRRSARENGCRARSASHSRSGGACRSERLLNRQAGGDTRPPAGSRCSPACRVSLRRHPAGRSSRPSALSRPMSPRLGIQSVPQSRRGTSVRS